MKILVAAASSSSHISGVQRHALNVVKCLLLRPEITSVHLILGSWQTGMIEIASLSQDRRLVTHVVDIGQGTLGRNRWYYRQLPKLVAQIEPDLVHLTYPVPVNASAIPCPIILTLHDLYPYEIPENFGFPKVFFNRFILQQCVRNVDAIACVSEITVRRMMQYVSRSAWSKTRRIYNCVDPQPPANPSPLPGWRGEPFILSVAQHRRNKNIALLIGAFHRLLRTRAIYRGTKLIIVGIAGPETSRLNELREDLGLERHVLFLEGISEAELRWCYSQCEVFVAPSSTEGFGLPVAEALLAGCRVVCTDIPAFREISQTGCHFVPYSKDMSAEFANAIASALEEPKPAPALLPQFSSEQLGEEYLELYTDLITSRAHQGALKDLLPAGFNSLEQKSL